MDHSNPSHNITSDVSSSKMEAAYDTISSKLKLSQEQSIGDEKEGVRVPLNVVSEDEDELDVGQEDHLLDF